MLNVIKNFCKNSRKPQHLLRYISLSVLFILLVPALLSAQTLTPEAPAKFITRIPFKIYSGGVMVVSALIENDKDSLNFILDTGSGGISLDSSTCSQLNIATQLTDTAITGIGGIRKVAFAFDKTLHLPGLDLKHLNFHVNNYEVLSSVYGDKIDGIIGYSFFSRYILYLNFDSLYMDVFTPGKYDYPRKGHTLHPLFTSIPILYLGIKDEKKIKANFYFDTGAGLCFLMSEKFAKDSAVLLKKRKPVVTQAEGMLGRLMMRETIIKELQIGPYRFHGVPVFIYEDKYNVTSYPFSGGLIGNELLRRFNITLNYGERIIHIIPNGNFSEPFDYSYTGFALYQVDKNIVIGEIVAGSPADKAGLKMGDEIMAIDNNVSKNIKVYKNMLQIPNQTFQLIIFRNGKILEKKIKTKRIS